jgi:hypothetical protein
MKFWYSVDNTTGETVFVIPYNVHLLSEREIMVDLIQPLIDSNNLVMEKPRHVRVLQMAADGIEVRHVSHVYY